MQTEYWIWQDPVNCERLTRVYVSPEMNCDFLNVSMIDAAFASTRSWAQFTPLEIMQRDMQLLDCVPLNTAIPDVGIRVNRKMYLFY